MNMTVIGRSYRITVTKIASRNGKTKSSVVERHYHTNETEAATAFATFPRPSRKGTFKLTLEELNAPKIIESRQFVGIAPR
jgi:hypothetical protein